VLPQAPMGADEMVVGAPPFHLVLEAGASLRRGPGMAGQRGHTLADGRVEAFHEGRLRTATPAQGPQGDLERASGAAAHLIADADKAAPTVAFVQLSVHEPGIDLPAPAPSRGDLRSEVRGQCVIVEA